MVDVDGIEICDIPIGEDDTRGSLVWVFYRNRLYSGRTGCEMDDHPEKKKEKREKLHECGREESWRKTD